MRGVLEGTNVRGKSWPLLGLGFSRILLPMSFKRNGLGWMADTSLPGSDLSRWVFSNLYLNLFISVSWALDEVMDFFFPNFYGSGLNFILPKSIDDTVGSGCSKAIKFQLTGLFQKKKNVVLDVDVFFRCHYWIKHKSNLSTVLKRKLGLLNWSHII
jgi:hypothetical protein